MSVVNRLRGPIGLLTAWLMVVAVGSAMVWTVISRTGDDLIPVGNPSFQASEQQEESAPVVAGVPQPTSKQIVIRAKRPEPTPTALPEQEPPKEQPKPKPSPSPSVDDEDKDWDGNTYPRIRATWRGDVGLVVSECQGWRVRLVGAPAESGYHVEVLNPGPRTVRVQFTSQAEPLITEVYSGCRDGKPRFFSRTGDGDNWGNGKTTSGT